MQIFSVGILMLLSFSALMTWLSNMKGILPRKVMLQ